MLKSTFQEPEVRSRNPALPHDQPHRHSPSSPHRSFLVYKTVVIIVPASQSCWGLVPQCMAPAQCLVYSELWLLGDRKGLGCDFWLHLYPASNGEEADAKRAGPGEGRRQEDCSSL